MTRSAINGVRAYELLKDPVKWTKQHFAIDSLGNPCLAESDKAAAWDVSGAIVKCYGQSISAVVARLDLVEKVGNLSAWNDASEHPEIISVLTELGI
jgi:hypothetical protein